MPVLVLAIGGRLAIYDFLSVRLFVSHDCFKCICSCVSVQVFRYKTVIAKRTMCRLPWKLSAGAGRQAGVTTPADCTNWQHCVSE